MYEFTLSTVTKQPSAHVRQNFVAITCTYLLLIQSYDSQLTIQHMFCDNYTTSSDNCYEQVYALNRTFLCLHRHT